MKKIVVILPVYKNDKVPYIKLSFDSILNQTYKDTDLFIGVDGPVGKDLEECLKKYEQDERITVEWFKENRGLAIVLNDLLDICFEKGYEYIARMDAMTSRRQSVLKSKWLICYSTQRLMWWAER